MLKYAKSMIHHWTYYLMKINVVFYYLENYQDFRLE